MPPLASNAAHFAIATWVVVALSGCGPRQPAAPPAAGPPEVTVAKPLVLKTLDWDEYTGRLAPVEEVDVAARVTGYLLSHHFEEGQPVERGQLLFVIDPRPYEATLAQAEATKKEAIAKQEQAKAQIGTAEARKQQATAATNLASAQLRRAEPLLPSGAISQDEYDEYFNAVRQAEADGYSADAEIAAAKAADAAAQAAIITADAAREAAQLDLSYCRIEAPISGRISNRRVTEGNLISSGMLASPLTTIVSTDPIHAIFDANEQALLKYIRLAKERNRDESEKTPVYMALSDEDGFPHHGYIDFVDNRVDRSTGSIRARAIFPNPDGVLVPGVFVRMRIPGSVAADRVLIPDAAIATDQASKIVYIVEDGKVAIRKVTTGPLSKGLREILDGLTGDETVVTRGLQRCQPGIEVKTTTETIEAGEGDGLPDEYEPVPPEKWLRRPVASDSPAGVSGGSDG